MKNGIRWLIVEVVCIVAVVIGAVSIPGLKGSPVGALLALIIGTFGAGYAASRLDAITGPIRASLHIGQRQDQNQT